jgi:ubiquinone/menaquinone biosynthesis C-methylase UbiE
MMADSYASRRPKELGLSSWLASKEMDRRDPEDYRELVKRHYSGLAGWFTLLTGWFTGHESLADDLFTPERFDITGCKRVLDAGCGNGRYLRFLNKRADPDATLVGCDLSPKMLNRARNRLKSDRPFLHSGDVTRLPYRDGTFDAVVCGWVLEHLLSLYAGLEELARVVKPGGKLLLLTTEHTLTGAICSRVYHSRMIHRVDLRVAATLCGLTWYREYSWSLLHRWLRLGGIVVELRKPL